MEDMRKRQCTTFYICSNHSSYIIREKNIKYCNCCEKSEMRELEHRNRNTAYGRFIEIVFPSRSQHKSGHFIIFYVKARFSFIYYFYSMWYPLPLPSIDAKNESRV